ncbi:hypothetical protein LZ554_002278 [Drepanopeziza brunnea f. sp. 'monogermtubi']|nr:hypothetical protein LZ554_002278 [Drepanopeziza brunnea f. sp. 'monogermtubi']
MIKVGGRRYKRRSNRSSTSSACAPSSVSAPAGEKNKYMTTSAEASKTAINYKGRFKRNFGEEVVTIYVGPKRKKFVLHKTLLCNSVDFFNGAFNSSFKEGCEGVMNLPEDKPAAFAIFVKWLCTRRIPRGRTQSYLDSLVDLYIFADKICEVALKDTITDVIQDIATKYKLRDDTFVPVLEKLWSISLPEPGLVRLVACIIVDSFVRKSHKEKVSWFIMGIRLKDDKVIFPG